jgi:hypothetical protein
MAFYSSYENRFIFLIEEMRLAILSGSKIIDAIKDFSEKFSEFYFLKDLEAMIGKGKNLSEALESQIGRESSKNIKQLLEALNSGDFAAQKLEDLRDGIIKEKKENFENVASSVTSKIGWLAFFAIIPIGTYFLSTLAKIFKSTGFSELVIGNSAKIAVTFICAAIFLGVLFSKRLKNG